MRTASGLAMLVLVLVLIVVGGGALKLLMDRQSMASMIDGYGQTLASMPVPPGPAVQAFASARQRATTGDYAGAQSDLQRGVGLIEAAPPAVATPPTGAPPVGEAVRRPSPEQLQQAANELPESARPFFKEHPELLQQVIMLKARAEGRGPSEEMNKYAKQIVEAAAKGDEAGVKAVIEEVRGKLGPGRMPGARTPGGRTPGGRMPGRGPRGSGEAQGQVQQWIAQARQIIAQAKRAGADTSKVAELVNRAEQLLARGNEREAAQKMEEAMGLMRDMAAGAPRGARRLPGGPGAPGRGGPRMARGARGPAGPGALPGLMGALLGQMQSESAAIVGAMQDIENAGLALLEKNHEQIREILSSATEKLAKVGKSRSALDKQLQQMQRAPAGPGQRGPGPGGRRQPGGARQGPDQQQGPRAMRPPTGAEPPPDPRRLHDLLGRALDEVRKLSPEEYEEQREDMIGRIAMALMRPPDEAVTVGPDEGLPRPGMGLPPLELPEEEPTKPGEREELRERIRQRLRMLHEPYLMLIEAEIEMDQVDRLIQQARDSFAADGLLETGKSVNHAGDLIWQLMQMHRAELEPIMRERGALPEAGPQAESRPRRGEPQP